MYENHFDQAAASWDDNPHRQALTRAVAQAIAQTLALDRSMSVLDFGCGTGSLSALLASMVGPIDAADPSQGMVAQLQAKLTASDELKRQIHPIHLAGPIEQLDAGPWDLIVSAMVLHHVDQAVKTLSDLASKLRPGGGLALADLAEEDGSFHGEMTVPHNGFAPQRLADVLTRAGLVDVQIRIFHEIRKELADGSQGCFPVFLLSGTKKQ